MHNQQILEDIEGVLKIRVVNARSEKEIGQYNEGKKQVIADVGLKYMGEDYEILSVKNPVVTLIYDGTETTMKSAAAKSGASVFDHEFSIKVKGLKNLSEKAVI